MEPMHPKYIQFLYVPIPPILEEPIQLLFQWQQTLMHGLILNDKKINSSVDTTEEGTHNGLPHWNLVPKRLLLKLVSNKLAFCGSNFLIQAVQTRLHLLDLNKSPRRMPSGLLRNEQA
jgi:hypothetical protein